MHQVVFFPVGNADCCRIDVSGGLKLLFDYANYKDPNDPNDLRVDLPGELRGDLESAGRKDFDVVAFTHADDDHIHGFSEFFYLEHAKAYQDGDRVRINELWVPAAVILETGLVGEAAILRAEARHRLKSGKGIRVFSRPERLKEWLEKEGLSVAERQALLTQAGQLVPGLDKNSKGIEVFVHSPFAERQEDALVDRNEASLVFQVTLSEDGQDTHVMLSADTVCDVWADIVSITRAHGREERLSWDVFKLPHHCSYLSLSSERGEEKTVPIPEVTWLFDQGRKHSKVVSSSKPIPGDDQDPQPPHRQAARFYMDCMADREGQFLVTMEHPTRTSPQPLIIKIDRLGAQVEKRASTGGVAIITRQAPRAGAANA